MATKSELRRYIKQEKATRSPEELLHLSFDILNKLEQLPAFQHSKTILLYHSLNDEVNTHDFIQKWSASKTIILPVVHGDLLDLRYYTTSTATHEGAFGIIEPEGQLLTDYNKIDLVIVPGVAFDAEGHRLGRGKGYYDKLLPHVAAPKIGICFPFQLLDRIPTEETDINMNKVLTCDS